MHLQHRSQYDHESVQAYADALQLLFLQTGFPIAAQWKTGEMGFEDAVQL